MTAQALPSVVHVLWTGQLGGIERLVHDLALEQNRVGMPVRVAVGRPSGPFTERLRGSAVPVVDLRLRSGYDLRPLNLLRGARLLRGSDLLHLHGFNLPVAAMALAARRPIVFTEHGNFGLGRRPPLAERAKWKAQGWFLRRSIRALVANSDHTARVAAERYGLSGSRIRKVYNGARFADTKGGGEKAGGKLVVAYVGRLAGSKRVERLLQAAAATDPGDDIQVLIVGGGPAEEGLRSSAASLGLEGRVRFLGYREDVPDILASADVLVQPGQESFGLAVVEGCGQGALPIVFEDGGGVLEVLPPDGIVVRDTSELARTLSAIESSPALSRKARAARARWARERFSIERAAREHLAVYEQVLAAVRREVA